MASFTITGYTAAPRTLQDNEYGVVAAGGTYVTNATTAITSAINHNVTVANYGSIMSFGFRDTLSLGGQGSNVFNSGQIVSERDAVHFTYSGTVNSFANSVVQNSGTIYSARNIAVYFRHYAVNLHNSGDIFGGSQGVYVAPPASGGGSVSAINNLRNSGTITAGDGAAINVFAGLNWLTNSGDILGDVNFRTAAAEPIFTGNGDRVVNSGLIAGDVNLGAQPDLLRNIGDGSISGTVSGEAGDDTLIGGKESDAFDGGEGNDVLRGRSGEDSLDGGINDDSLMGGADDDYLLGNLGNDTLRGNAGDDTLDGDLGNDHLRGGSGDDDLNGGGWNDLVQGGTGNDTLDGGGSNDILQGGAGDDLVLGDWGNDQLWGGSGDDTVTGGAGNDVFVYRRGHDLVEVTDFTDGADRIDLRSWGFVNFLDVQNRYDVTETTDGVEFDFGGGNILTVNGVAIADLTFPDFIF